MRVLKMMMGQEFMEVMNKRRFHGAGLPFFILAAQLLLTMLTFIQTILPFISLPRRRQASP